MTEPKSLITDQPAPIANDGLPLWQIVIEDMRARDAEGRRKYGVPLQANNGRNMLVDAYQEVLDMAVYIRGAIEERAELRASSERLTALCRRSLHEVEQLVEGACGCNGTPPLCLPCDLRAALGETGGKA